MCGVIVVLVGLASVGYAQIWAAVTVVPAFEAERLVRVALCRRWGAFAILAGVVLLLCGLQRSRRDV